MEVQTFNSSKIRDHLTDSTHTIDDSKTLPVCDPSVLLLPLRKKLSDLETYAKSKKLDEVPIDDELKELMISWQNFVKDNPITTLDPIPSYLDISVIATRDFAEILNRIDAITGQKQIKNEPNSRIDYLNLFDKFSNLQMENLDKLGKEEALIFEDMKRCDEILTELVRLESEAEATSKKSISLDEKLKNKITTFLTESWPRIKEKNNLDEDRNPFASLIGASSIKTEDLSTHKSRTTFLTTQLNQNLTLNVRDIERITRKLGHLIDIVSHFNKDDPFIRRCIQGFLTR